jgi:hypothetical protein
MIYIKNFKHFEALKPSQFRKYVKEFDKSKYLSIFKKIGDKYDHDRNYYRVYIPLIKETIKGYISDTHKEVDSFLKDNDCKLLDYIKGKAKFNNSKNETTIGKLLTKLKNEDLNKKFISDEKRKSLSIDDELSVVISRHPYDIAGSDTDRNWTNCMTIGTDKSNRLTKIMDEYEKTTDDLKKEELLYKIKNYKSDGVNVRYLMDEVKEGSLISYLIKSSDKNIENPLAVLNIKPYENQNGELALFTSNNMYGKKRNDFKKTVDLILNEYFNNYSGEFRINNKVYNDSDLTRRFNFKNSTTEEILNHLSIEKYKINEDGSVDIKGSVDLRFLQLNKIPLKFKNVTGNFNCYNNQLTSLEGAPQTVGGNFNCQDNQLISLEGAPQTVGGDFYCDDNQLTSLEGAPQTVGGNFSSRNNRLTSLEGAPQSIEGDFDCYNNQLTSLKDAPQKIGGEFNCSQNQLTSLEGAPQSVGKWFGCSDNQLTSLEGAPQTVMGDFYCMNNLLTSLEGAPQKVGGDFYCYNNQLTNLKNGPKFIGGDLINRRQ